MSRASMFSRLQRIACVFLILFTFTIQAPVGGSAQSGPPGAQPPVDVTLLSADQGTPAPEFVPLPARPVASGPDDMHDYTILDENGQPFLPPAIPDAPAAPVASADQTALLTSDGSVDSTLPDTSEPAMLPYAAVPDQALESLPQMLDPALDMTRSDVGTSVQNPDQVELAADIDGNLDDFNRPNGALGASWTVANGAFAIANNLAQTTLGNSTVNLALYSGIGVNLLEADISIQPGAVVAQYAALVLNYGAGVNNLFIKVQDNNKTGHFNTAGC